MTLPQRRLLVVSNRLPVVLEKTASGWELKPSAGGLVTALAPVLSLRGGLWIGWPGLALAPGGGWEQVLAAGLPDRGYELAPVLLSEEEVHGFYEGFSNAVLWPLFHDLVSACDFQPAYWYAYLDANRKFAEQVVARSRPDDFIWVHDYQLIHVAEMVRERAAGRQIGFFLHIPFPPLDLFLKLPWRAQILGALLAYDLLGFQTQRDRRNFLNCLKNLLPEVAIADGPVAEVRVGGRTVRVGNFPIGIDADTFAERAASSEVAERVAVLRERFAPRQLIVGVDRLDYTKGLPERLMAYRNALERYPELRERAVFFQVVVPSREGVREYQALKGRVDQLVGEINGQSSSAGRVAVHYHYKSLSPRDLAALYRLARVGFVTSLKDGMNLVAKEFCACQTDRTGVLVLSEFAGAAAQLAGGALLVNPHDVEGMADALHTAFQLSADERRERMERLQDVVREQDIFWWVDYYLTAALGEVPDHFRAPKEYFPAFDFADSWVDI